MTTGSAAVSLTLLGALVASPVLAEEPVRRHAIPEGAAAPDVVVRGAHVHLVYGRGSDALYERSEDGGRTFGAPVRVSDRLGPSSPRRSAGPASRSAPTAPCTWCGLPIGCSE